MAEEVAKTIGFVLENEPNLRGYLGPANDISTSFWSHLARNGGGKCGRRTSVGCQIPQAGRLFSAASGSVLISELEGRAPSRPLSSKTPNGHDGAWPSKLRHMRKLEALIF
jgi:hypothetical protein